MAGTRTVRRDSRGRYAGSGGGRLSTEKSGGFANAAFRSRASAPKGLAPRSTVSPTRSALKGRGTAKNVSFKSRAAKAGKRAGIGLVAAGAVGLAAKAATTGARRRMLVGHLASAHNISRSAAKSEFKKTGRLLKEAARAVR